MQDDSSRTPSPSAATDEGSTSLLLVFPPLTTVFTAPESCQGVSATPTTSEVSVWLLKPENFDCLPPGYITDRTFSPGICPSGYTTEWSSIRTGTEALTTMAQCC